MPSSDHDIVVSGIVMLDMPKASLKLGSVWPLLREFCRCRSEGIWWEEKLEWQSWEGNLGATGIVGVKSLEEMALEEALLKVREGGGKGGEWPLEGVG